MFTPSTWFNSVETIALVWLVSSTILCAWTIVGLSRFRWKNLVRVWRDERGAAYTLGYVMTLPFYILFVCVVVETSLILMTKAGTVYAAYEGARSATVWDTAAPTQAADTARQAAQQAFVPFANGMMAQDRNASEATASTEARAYLEAYRAYATKRSQDQYILAKFADATRFMTVTVTPAKNFDDDVTCTVKYRFHFHVPLVGNLFGTADGAGLGYDIQSTIKLQNEGPRNQAQHLGISYASPD